jgi:hypothetical protein
MFEKFSKVDSACLLRVKTGKSRSEQLFSDLPPEADLTADIVDVSQVPLPSQEAQHAYRTPFAATRSSGSIRGLAHLGR